MGHTYICGTVVHTCIDIYKSTVHVHNLNNQMNSQLMYIVFECFTFLHTKLFYFFHTGLTVTTR